MTSEAKLIKLIEQSLNDKKTGIKTEPSDNTIDGSEALEIKKENIKIKDYPGSGKESVPRKQLPDLGVISVKNNHVYVEAIPGQHNLPTIQPTKNVDLYINGEIVITKRKISSKDYIWVKPQSTVKPLKTEIKIADNGSYANLHVTLQTTITYLLEDQPPRHNLILATSVKKEHSFPLSMNEILEIIKKNGILHGINYPVIQSLISNPKNGTYRIAEGIPPKDPIDDTVVVLFDEKPIKKVKTDADKIDFYNISRIPSVEENTLLAVKKEGKPGQPGMSVTGEMVLPREPKKIQLNAGKGVRVENNTVFATKPGRPVVKRIGTTYIFYIDQHLVHYKDIDISVGNQNFSGNITVYGNVLDGMSIRAGGNVQISGYVNRASIVALESIQASKCIGSSIQAGGESFYLENCYFTLKELHSSLINLYGSLEIIIKSPQFKNYETQLGLIVLLLIEKKFPSIPKLLKEVIKSLEMTPVELPNEIIYLMEMIKENIPPRNLTLDKLQVLINQMQFAEEFFGQMQGFCGDVDIGYVFNSSVSASGDVQISGQGSFGSRITSGGNVYISGVLRGGEVRAQGDIIVHEAGSELGTKTFLKSINGKIIIQKRVFDGVIVSIGNRTTRVVEPAGRSEFVLTDEEIKVKSAWKTPTKN